jgi:hypothetical protein
MVVISIQPAELLRFGELQLSTHKTILRTVVRLNAQPTVGPQLPLAVEGAEFSCQRLAFPQGKMLFSSQFD